MSSHDTCVSEYLEWARRQPSKNFDAIAREAVARFPQLVRLVLEVIGSWPSSEPELAALQRAYP